jgi:hypothetical protein
MAEPKAWIKAWQKTLKKCRDQSKLNRSDHKPFLRQGLFGGVLQQPSIFPDFATSPSSKGVGVWNVLPNEEEGGLFRT